MKKSKVAKLKNNRVEAVIFYEKVRVDLEWSRKAENSFFLEKGSPTNEHLTFERPRHNLRFVYHPQQGLRMSKSGKTNVSNL